MIYPENIDEKLGFNVIKEELRRNCVSEIGSNLIDVLEFYPELEKVRNLLQQVNDFGLLLSESSLPVNGSFNDIDTILRSSEIEGNWLTAHDLYKVFENIQSATALGEYLRQASRRFQSLANLSFGFALSATIEQEIGRSVDGEGNILDSASPALRTVRKQILSEEGALRKKINSVFRQAKANGLVPEGASISIRDGRMVIPLTASHKRQIQGFIHDESATGNIVFLEPTVVLDSNNKIRELQLAENREVRLVLINLTSRVRENIESLRMASNFLGEVDLLWAKSKLAKSLGCSMPEFVPDKIEYRDLRHPLLIIATKEQKRKVVPHQLTLDDSNRILMISGPNAGGKSVALKSLGLNQMMLQYGLLPCCDPDSKVRVFEDIFIDIGDEQSIDNDLSTYSSHLKNMNIMLASSGENSLVLIDEFGSGTDPLFGGAIAEAILEELLLKKPFGLITTHFSNLKLYADSAKGIQNGAMLFDLKKLRPLYKLEIGRPGSSFSLEVAAQSGIDNKVINKAKAGIGTDQIEIEQLLGRLEDEKRKFEKQNQTLSQKDQQLNQLKNEYQILKKKLEDRQKEIINLAKEEAARILSQTNREIEKTIRHIKENKAEKKETKKVRESLAKFAGKVKPLKTKPISEEAVVIGGILAVGDKAIVTENNVLVKVIEIKGKKAKVLMGEFQSVVDLRLLQKVSNREAKKLASKGVSKSVNQTVNQALSGFSSTLDVRGTRASELLPQIQKFLDQALMLNQQTIKVIHGKGNGVLRKLVHEELKQWSQVVHFENEHVERGGDGATVIKLA